MTQRSVDIPFGACGHFHPAELHRLLVDDTGMRLAHARRAALGWAATETHGAVEIAAERLLVTPRGLLYAAELHAPTRTLLYLATPPALFESVADHAHAAHSLAGTAAAVDSRLGHDLMFPWPLDRGLLRTFDTDELFGLVREPAVAGPGY